MSKLVLGKSQQVMNRSKVWVSPKLTSYGSVENITEQQQVGSVTKNGGAGDTISVTIAGVTSVVAGGSSGTAAGSSLVNITPGATLGGGPC